MGRPPARGGGACAKRLPAVLALRPLLGPLRSKGKDVLFLGWFGPIGAAALYARLLL